MGEKLVFEVVRLFTASCVMADVVNLTPRHNYLKCSPSDPATLTSHPVLSWPLATR